MTATVTTTKTSILIMLMLVEFIAVVMMMMMISVVGMVKTGVSSASSAIADAIVPDIQQGPVFPHPHPRRSTPQAPAAAAAATTTTTPCESALDCSMLGACLKGDSHDHDDDRQSLGECKCLQGWTGPNCEVLDLVPVDPTRLGFHQSSSLQRSTWGGSIVFDATTQLYHMYASEIIWGCGLYYWFSNSRVVHATYRQVDGPYTRQDKDVVVDVFAHEPNVIVDPVTGQYVMFLTMAPPDGPKIKPVDCRRHEHRQHHRHDRDRNYTSKHNSNLTMSSTSISGDTISSRKGRTRATRRYLRNHPHHDDDHKLMMSVDSQQQQQQQQEELLPKKDTYMMYASSPDGPWSTPQLVLNCTEWNRVDDWDRADNDHKVTICDSNLNGMILEDGKTFVGIWRRCETHTLRTVPHLLIATDWRDPSTYQPFTHPILNLGGAGAEDPSQLWMTRIWDDVHNVTLEALHVVLHDEQITRCMEGQCGGQGRHAWTLLLPSNDGDKDDDDLLSSSSLNNTVWQYARANAYDRYVEYTNGTTVEMNTRARPHLVFDRQQRQEKDNMMIPVALSTGVEPYNDGSGYVWTLVQKTTGA